MNNTDLLAVRSYVTYKDNTNYDHVSKDIVIIDITHSNLQQKHIEIRLYKSDTLDILRTKIYRQTGTGPLYQHIQVYNNDNTQSSLVCEIPSTTCGSTYKIGYFIPHHTMSIHVIDTNPNSISKNRALEDVSLVPKYTLSTEEYRNRTSSSSSKNNNTNGKSNNTNTTCTTLFEWKQQQIIKDPTFTLQKYEQQYYALQSAKMYYQRNHIVPKGYIYDPIVQQIIVDPKSSSSPNNNNNNDTDMTTTTSTSYYGIETIQHCIIGERCEIRIGQRRGIIRWTGQFQHMTTTTDNNSNSGYWVGIQLDEPMGKNNGTLHNITYFTNCDMNYGIFVRGTQVNVGKQYTVLNDLDSDDSDDDDDDDDEI